MPAVKRASDADDLNVAKLPKLQQSAHNVHQSFAPVNHQPSPAVYQPAVQQSSQHEHAPQPSQVQHQPLQQSPQTPGQSGPKKRTTGSSSRTGQACDRCKARKIRCDDTPGGCLPCRQNHTECTTTDRITNRPQVRGHTEAIEQEAAILRQQVSDLQAQLKENNIEPRVSTFPLQQSQQWPQPSQASASQVTSQSVVVSTQAGNAFAQDGIKNSPQEANVFAQPTADVSTGSSKYSGVSSNSNDMVISPVTGISLSVFGNDVNLAHLVPEETESKLSATSWDNLFKYIAMGYHAYPNQPPPLARLPLKYEECERMAHFYLTWVNAFLPVLDRPEFLALVRKFYTPNFRPSAAEKVTLHAVLAVVKTYYSLRSPEGARANTELDAQFRAHMEYTLQHVALLISGRSLEDIKGLALIIIVLRNLPTPHAAFFMTHWVNAIVSDMGLNRSASKRESNAIGMTVKQQEARKRIFWTLLAILTSICGKLARPIAVRIDTVDIEIPEATQDLLPDETVHSPEKRCSFLPAIESFKLLSMFQDTVHGLYIARPVGDYETIVRNVETRMKSWRENLPTIYKLGRPESDDPENHVIALWLAYWDAEIQLLLHHPAVCRSVNPQIISANMQQAVEAAFSIIEKVAELRNAKCHDTTWLNASTYIAAIFTLLFAFNHRRDTLTLDEIAKLQTDLDACYGLLEDVGNTLGTGAVLPNRIQAIIGPIMYEIKTYVEQKQNPAAVSTNQDPKQPTKRPAEATAGRPPPSSQMQSLQAPSPESQRRYSPHQHAMNAPQQPRMNLSNVYNQQQLSQDTPQPQSQPGYNVPIQQSPLNPQQYNTNAYIQPPYDSTTPTSQLHPFGQAQVAAAAVSSTPRHFQGAASDPERARQQQQEYISHLNTYYAWNDMGGPNQWQNFTQTLRSHMPGEWGVHVSHQDLQQQAQQAQNSQQQHDYMTSANALMAMQGADGSGNGGNGAGMGNMGMNVHGGNASVNGANVGFQHMNGQHVNGGPGWPVTTGYMGQG